MDFKQLFIAIAIILSTFVLIIGTVLGVYFFKPELLGFAPPKVAKHKIKNNSTKTQDSLLAKNNRKKIIADNIPYDSLLSMNTMLIDSIDNKNNIIKIYNDSIVALAKRITQLDINESKINDSIANIKNLMSSNLEDLQNYKKLYAAKDSLITIKKDSLTEKNLIQFAKIYNNTAPSEVAKILENLANKKDVAKIIKLMQPRKAAKVLEYLKPELAADILLQGSF